MESDEVLVEAAKRDKAEFGKLYERYIGRIYSYCYYRTGYHHEAEDLAGKVFLQALSHIDGYKQRGIPFSAWLFRIAHNLVANWHRDRSRRRSVDLDDVDLHSHLIERDPLEQTEERIEVRKAVALLPPDRQSLIVLKYVDELSNAEIAAVFGKSEGAVKALLHRTLRSLRSTLQSGKAYEKDVAPWPEVPGSAYRPGQRAVSH